jgi:hypothetical protein
MEESAAEFYGGKIGGEKKLAETKVDIRTLREVIKRANPPHPIVFDASAMGKTPSKS